MIIIMKITDQPGRIFAVFVFGPLLILKGINFKDNLLILLGILIVIMLFIALMIYAIGDKLNDKK